MSLEEKRQHYKCGSKYLTLDQISKWPNTPNSGKQSSDIFFKFDPRINDKISVFIGDITCLEIDAIVNAANSRLAGGGGVDGFIHAAAGASDLQAECATLGGCETGHCKISGGYKLPAKCMYSKNDSSFARNNNLDLFCLSRYHPLCRSCWRKGWPVDGLL